MVPPPGPMMLLRVLEVALGSYSSRIVSEWSVREGFDAVGAASLMPDDPNVWTDGSLVLDQVTGVPSSSAGFFAHQSQDCWCGCRWGHVDHVRPVGSEGLSCRGFCSLSAPVQTVQRAELWGVILALRSSDAVHAGVDKLGDNWTVVATLLRLSLSMTVMFFCSLVGCFLWGTGR